MTHVFKKISLVLVTLAGMQAFGGLSQSQKEGAAIAHQWEIDRINNAEAIRHARLGWDLSKLSFGMAAANLCGVPHPAIWASSGAYAALIGLRYYTSNMRPRKEFKRFKERTPVYEHFTLGDSY